MYAPKKPWMKCSCDTLKTALHTRNRALKKHYITKLQSGSKCSLFYRCHTLETVRVCDKSGLWRTAKWVQSGSKCSLFFRCHTLETVSVLHRPLLSHTQNAHTHTHTHTYNLRDKRDSRKFHKSFL